MKHCTSAILFVIARPLVHDLRPGVSERMSDFWDELELKIEKFIAHVVKESAQRQKALLPNYDVSWQRFRMRADR